VAYLDELVGGVGIRVSANEGRGEVGSPAVVSTAVRVEALESKVFLHPGCILERVWLQKGDNVVLDRDVLAASHGQMLESVDPWCQHTSDQRDARHSGIAEVQTGQPRAVRRYDLLQQGVEGVGLRLSIPVIGRLVAWGAHRGGRLGQPERQRLPCQRVLAQEIAQVPGGVVEIKEGDGRDLGEQRFEDGGIRGDDRFEEAEPRLVGAAAIHCYRFGVGSRWLGGIAGGTRPEVGLAVLLRRHASWPLQIMLFSHSLRERVKEACRRTARGSCRASEGGRVSEALASQARVHGPRMKAIRLPSPGDRSPSPRQLQL
jgi:hypothetical protein